jgi:hypothetical protein
LWVADFISRFIGCTPNGITIAYYTSNLIPHEPATSSGMNYSLRTAVTNCCVELLWQTPIADFLDNQSFTAFITLAINCWSVRCHDTYMFTDRYLGARIPHCFGCRGYSAYRTVESNLVVSFAWQWIFPALGNSAFQTTCHIAPFLGLFVPNSLTASRRCFRGLRCQHLFLVAWFRFLTW